MHRFREKDFMRGAKSSHFIHGLDAIRFFCALWVYMGHYGAPPLPASVDKTTVFGLLATGVYNNLTPGPAAVIVFFVISGLCIHAQSPSVFGSWLDIIVFLTRRYLRIIPPMLIAIAIAEYATKVKLDLFEQTILWSLLAEMIYYTLYPLLLWIRSAVGDWKPIIITAFAVSLMVAATNPTAGNYPSYGVSMNWLLGLPCWLLGCELADRLKGPTNRRPEWNIWIWRGGILLLACACSALRFHSPIGYPWTLNFFALAAQAWLYREIVHFKSGGPRGVFEWAGKWSYSLYLVHPLAVSFYRQAPIDISASLPAWLAQTGFVLIFSYGFAVLFEFTSHRFARYVAGVMKGNAYLASISAFKWPSAVLTIGKSRAD